MKPLKALVCGSSNGEFEIKLETGRITRVPIREGIEVGDNVLVGYDFATKQVKHIMSSTHVALGERQEHNIIKEPDEDPERRVNTLSIDEVLGFLSQDSGEVREFGVDDFEVLRLLSQGSEDGGSSNGE